ncbi:MAG TPA: OsmC family protein [Acidimicrobiia bacterium]
MSAGKVHRFAATCAWWGSTAAGYEAYRRTHHATAPPAEASLTLASAPEFRGDPSLVNPEQLVVLAAASCQLLSFLAVAARARIDVVRYDDDAEGVMPDDVEPMAISRITLRPRITVRGDVDGERLAHLCDVAHRECFVANSLRTEVVVEPTFVRA